MQRDGLRQNEKKIGEIATTTGQSAKMLRAMNTRAYNAPTGNLTDDRFYLYDRVKIFRFHIGNIWTFSQGITEKKHHHPDNT